MKKYFYKSLTLLFILFQSTIFAQYSIQDSSLIRTTFLRKFDKNIISQYLHSNNSTKINAALLSISHSEDTTFIDSIIKLDFQKYGNYILFAMGQIGESKKSTEYLLQKLYLSNNPFITETYNAIGKCGDSLTFTNLFRAINNSEVTPESFPLAIFNFHSRGIKNKNSIKYLSKYLNQNLENEQLLQTLFILFRMGSTESIVPKLITILNEPDKKTAKLYALNNLRKLKYFPNKIELLKKLLTSKSWEIRTETANTACYFPFKNKDEVELYLKLLNDKNPNVSRTAAIALKKIKYSQNKNWLKSKIENLLQNEDITINGRGELLITYASLFKISAEDIIDEYDDLVKEKFIYRMMANNVTDPKFNYEYLIEQIPESNEAELLDLLPAYLALQNNFINNRKYAQYLFTVLQSNKPSSVSIIADGLELPLIHNYQEVLHELIIAHVFKDKNNAQYSEAIISLAKLAYKLDSKFYDSVIDMLASSQLYSVKKYAMEKQGVSNTIQKDEKLFNQLWNFAFRYKHATITTNKGNFKIGLKPEFAPITCASFTALVKKDFYDNVTFHRVVPNFVIQTGDTMNTGWGGPEYEIISEFSPLPFKKGAVGIASIGKDTEGSQWFVMHSLFPHLNGRYTNWAEVIEKINIVDIIDEGDRIINIVLE